MLASETRSTILFIGGLPRAKRQLVLPRKMKSAEHVVRQEGSLPERRGGSPQRDGALG